MDNREGEMFDEDGTETGLAERKAGLFTAILALCVAELG